MRSRPLIGAHIRTTGGLDKAFGYATEWGAEVLQIFTGNPRQFALRLLGEAQLMSYHETRKEHGNPLVISHASYLINLASPKEHVRLNARQALKDELNRCAALSIPYVVLHLGAALESPREDAHAVLVSELDTVVAEADSTTVVLLETSAGQGTTLGTRFEEVAWVLDRVARPERFGVCLDTCHVYSAGYDLQGDYEGVLTALRDVIGFDRLKAIHLNDSKTTRAAGVDRHEHIGEGHIGIEVFRRLVNDSRLREIPCFIETPDDLEHHSRNLTTLKSLAAMESVNIATRPAEVPRGR
jgi:deoxyribonuclease-4